MDEGPKSIDGSLKDETTKLRTRALRPCRKPYPPCSETKLVQSIAFVAPLNLEIGVPRAEIRANIYDPAGIRVAYAEVGDRMNLMLDIMRTNK